MKVSKKLTIIKTIIAIMVFQAENFIQRFIMPNAVSDAALDQFSNNPNSFAGIQWMSYWQNELPVIAWAIVLIMFIPEIIWGTKKIINLIKETNN